MVAAVSSEEKAEAARQAGADETLLYPRGPFDRDGQKALAEDQQDLADLRAGAIRVKRVADVTLVLAPTTVTQIEGDPSVTITATPDTTDLGALSDTVTTTLAGLSDLPAGVSAEAPRSTYWSDMNLPLYSLATPSSGWKPG